MKKFFVFIFAVFYLGLSTGFAFSIHFCMGKLSSVELFHTGDNTCSKCGMKNREGCCNSKLTVVKITDSQQLSSAALTIFSPLTAITGYRRYTNLPLTIQFLHTTFTDASPPPVTGAFLCILNCTFTI